MEANDPLDVDLAARRGLEKLGYTQEMTRVGLNRVTFVFQVNPGDIDDASIRRREDCSIFFSVSTIRQRVSRSRVHHCCHCLLAVTLGSFDTTTGLVHQLTSLSTQLSWQSVRCGACFCHCTSY